MDTKQLINLLDIFTKPRGKEITEEEIDGFIEIFNKLKIIGEYNSFYFAQLLYLFPFGEKEWKIYDKLEKNGKFGYLSKYLIKCARKNNIPEVYIKDYLSSKDNWKIAKKYYTSLREKEIKAIKKFKEKFDIGPCLDIMKENSRHESARDNIYRKTKNLLIAIIEKEKGLRKAKHK